MLKASGNETKTGVTWRQPVVCVIATIDCTVLAIWAVIEAPIPPAPVVSGLYVAAAVFVNVENDYNVRAIKDFMQNTRHVTEPDNQQESKAFSLNRMGS